MVFFKEVRCLKKALLTAFIAFLSCQVNAQIFNNKSDSKWDVMSSRNYDVIYPEGADSMAFKFASLFERYRSDVSLSSGLLPNERGKRNFPIVLMNHYAGPTGVVMAAPSESHLSTYLSPGILFVPLRTDVLDAIHENRHISQIEAGRTGDWRWTPYLFGDMGPALALNLYSNKALTEGDAVVMETALTNSGRGRTADFLEYYRMAFDNGEYRNWYRWRYGSQRLYTPDYYKVGYMTVAGIRTHAGYDDYYAPTFMENYLKNVSNIFCFRAFAKSVRAVTGKSVNEMWGDVSTDFEWIWREDDRKRGPFQELLPVLRDDSRYFYEYGNALQAGNGDIIATRTSMDETPSIVRITPDGKISNLIRLETQWIKMTYSKYTDCIYWTEPGHDRSFSGILSGNLRMMSLSDPSNKKFLTRGSIYHSPMASNDGKRIAVVESLEDGSYRIVLMDAVNGKELRYISLDGEVQVLDLAFSADDRFVVFSGIDYEGVGLFITDFTDVNRLEGPVPFSVVDMKSENGMIYMTSDKNGTKEIYSYRLEPADGDAMPRHGVMTQLTNTRYGVSYPFVKDGEICFSALTSQGRILSRAAESYSREVEFEEFVSNPIADKLTKQEKELQGERDMYYKNEQSDDRIVHSNYNKGLNFLRIHSWMPFFSNQGFFNSSVAGFDYERLSLGATALFQNHLGTLTGAMAVSAHPDPFKESQEIDGGEPWSFGFHMNTTYLGMVPKFEFTLDVGDRSALRAVSGFWNDTIIHVSNEFRNRNGKTRMSVAGSAYVFLPLDLTGNGWIKKVQVGTGVAGSNDQLAAGARNIILKRDGSLTSFDTDDPFTRDFYDNVRFLADAQFEIKLPVPNSRITPKWGVGAFARYTRSKHLGTVAFDLYGYTPGLSTVDGLRLELVGQHKIYDAFDELKDAWGMGVMDVRPRGFTTFVSEAFLLRSNTSARVSVDYFTPFAPVDLALGQVAYLRNLELNPFVDYTMCSSDQGMKDLYSAGVNLMFRFEKLILPNTYKIGVQYARNGGTLIEKHWNAKANSISIVGGISF